MIKLLQLQEQFREKLGRDLNNKELAFLKWMYECQKTETKLKS